MILHCYYQKVFGLVIILSLINVYLVQSRSVTKECLDYCSSGGICLQSKNGLKCICLPEWTGERCDIPRNVTLTKQVRASQADTVDLRNNLCNFAPPDFCKNNGICYVNDKKYACQCRYPYVGDNCDEVSECFDYCLNNGICTINNNNDPECSCMSGWSGIRCQKIETTSTVSTASTPTTTNAPCSYLDQDYCNSGTCVVLNNQARCQCPPKYTGNRCEISTEGTSSQTPSTVTLSITTSSITASPRMTCAQNPCQHNRPCYNTGNSYYCYCGAQYTGKNCEN